MDTSPKPFRTITSLKETSSHPSVTLKVGLDYAFGVWRLRFSPFFFFFFARICETTATIHVLFNEQ